MFQDRLVDGYIFKPFLLNLFELSNFLCVIVLFLLDWLLLISVSSSVFIISEFRKSKMTLRSILACLRPDRLLNEVMHAFHRGFQFHQSPKSSYMV